MNYSSLTTMNEMDFRIHTVVTSNGADKVIYYENYLSYNCKKIFVIYKYKHLGENTFRHCCRITVVYVNLNIFV